MTHTKEILSRKYSVWNGLVKNQMIELIVSTQSALENLAFELTNNLLTEVKQGKHINQCIEKNRFMKDAIVSYSTLHKVAQERLLPTARGRYSLWEETNLSDLIRSRAKKLQTRLEMSLQVNSVKTSKQKQYTYVQLFIILVDYAVLWLHFVAPTNKIQISFSHTSNENKLTITYQESTPEDIFWEVSNRCDMCLTLAYFAVELLDGSYNWERFNRVPPEEGLIARWPNLTTLDAVKERWLFE